MRSGSPRGMDEYRRFGLESQVANASPHELVQLMLDGAAARVAAARSAVEAGETALKGLLIGKAIGLVEGLRASLDAQRGGELAAHLAALYDYIARRLLEANLRSDVAILDEVADLLRELQAGWREVGRVVAAQGGLAAEAAAR
ncbi:MAG TPA: flagellar export chaperone FliS [Gammaproteobacteria bacterium]|nr:flagellar export chaperone FliS [Gammaproteobacteria bacterium]